jgi:hypothetical protein
MPEDGLMLALSRKVGKQIRIAVDVVVVKAIESNRVTIGIEAPKSVCVGSCGAPAVLIKVRAKRSGPESVDLS